MCAARVDVYSDQVIALLQGGGTRKGRASYALRDFDAHLDVLGTRVDPGTGFSMVRLLLDCGTVTITTREHDTFLEGESDGGIRASGVSRRARWATMILGRIYGVKPQPIHLTDSLGRIAVEVQHTGPTMTRIPRRPSPTRSRRSRVKSNDTNSA